MRKTLTMALAVSLMSLATLAWAGVLAAQAPSAPSGPPEQGAAPNGTPGHGGNVEKRLENLSQQLNLSPEQKEKIRPLLRHEAERIRQVRSNTSLTQGEAHQRIAMIRRNTRQRIDALLTPEQKKQWQEMRQEHRGGGGPQGGQHGAGGGSSPEAPSSPPSPPNPN